MNNFKNGFGGFGGANLQQLMKQAQKMQQEMEETKENLKNTTFTASSGGGVVSVTFTGDKKMSKISINKEIIDPEDSETLEDLIMAAVNECLNNIQKEEESKMPNIPGM